MPAADGTLTARADVGAQRRWLRAWITVALLRLLLVELYLLGFASAADIAPLPRPVTLRELEERMLREVTQPLREGVLEPASGSGREGRDDLWRDRRIRRQHCV